MKSKIDYKEISKLIDLLEKRNLLDFELETEGFKIKISREHKLPEVKEATVTTEHLKSDQKNEKKETIEEKKDKSTDNNLHFITSPMVGTFYRAPDPSSPPFVEIGEDIKKNQTLCIIEAMKLMNEIESDIDGIIEDIYVKNGNPVEYGQKLFSVKKK
ncbi:MAG: acetyl-CoA carboxylase biotin carboxyl carrier protein [Candidatus Aminicenantes bacterium]|nr:acetyl-CoA carboxylase biotin carboxyl carrier protein [Candidatus Aminicenantes bacterium]